MGGRGAVLLLDGAADRDQRPERERGVNVVCEAGYPQKGGDDGSPRVFERKDGTWASSYEVTADTVKFLDSKGEPVADVADVPF